MSFLLGPCKRPSFGHRPAQRQGYLLVDGVALRIEHQPLVPANDWLRWEQLRKSPPPDWVDASPFCPGVGEQGIVWAVQVSHLPHLAGDVELDVRVHPTFQERARNAVLLPQTVLQGVFAVQGVCLRYWRNRFILFLLGITWHIPRMKYSTTASSN